MRFDLVGFSDVEEYLDYFFGTLLETNWTYDYFVDWGKVRGNVRRHVKEISLLNSLCRVEAGERETMLGDIFQRYPETLEVIPLLLAIREKSIPILEMSEQAIYTCFDFSKRSLSGKEAEQLVGFCGSVGLLKLFSEVGDLYSYMLGVEVGLDTNSRKNRSGEIFERLVELLLNRTLTGLEGVQLKRGDPTIVTRRRKKADFVVYRDGEPRIVVECNFYSDTGSKPIETANAYIDFQRKVRELGLSFIWATDGRAWRKMMETIRETSREIDFVLNYKMLSQRGSLIIPKLLND